MASTSKAFKKCVDPCPRYLRWHTQSLRLLFGQGARTRCPWGENLCATSSTFAGRRHMIGKVVTGCVAILPYHTATQDRGSECRDFGFISRIVTALGNMYIENSRGRRHLSPVSATVASLKGGVSGGLSRWLEFATSTARCRLNIHTAPLIVMTYFWLMHSNFEKFSFTL